ncbi:hypothetical protein E8E14_001569 [Neopestalotiopsis sp. 37M]|nr:hypothetical protein E8E14_001569 [Neopestalotiopsis sp. 37M]
MNIGGSGWKRHEWGHTYWKLKNSSEMPESAANGCKGCQFFLALIKPRVIRTHKWLGKTETFDDYVKSAEPIRIQIEKPNEYRLYFGLDYPLLYLEPCAANEAGYDFPSYEGLKRPIPLDPNAPEVFELARLWLDCCSQHEVCGAQENTPLPTRLIEVPSDSKLPLRIYTSRKESRGKYVTLSHCWGSKLPFISQSQNIEQLAQGFEMGALPPSFQDAVIITRALGFTYLWIDALCIIQDDPEDWARESAAMTQVYHNATLMIAASAASDSSSGILKRTNLNRSPALGTDNNLLWQSPTTERCIEAEEPLGRRAWPFQEDLMAKRILLFKEQQMIWDCSACVYTESYGTTPANQPNYPGVGDDPLTRGGFLELISHKSSDMKLVNSKRNHLHLRLTYWYGCAGEYANLELTHASDKLPALSGLAHGLRVPELGQYLAGLWEVDIFRGMCWEYADKRDHDVEEYTCYVAPSWSYMRTRGKVVLLHHIDPDLRWDENEPLPNSSSMKRWKSIQEWERKWRPRLISHHVELETSDPHGRITNCWILIRAYCRKIIVHKRLLLWSQRCGDGKVHMDKMQKGLTWRFDAIDGFHGPWLVSPEAPRW